MLGQKTIILIAAIILTACSDSKLELGTPCGNEETYKGVVLNSLFEFGVDDKPERKVDDIYYCIKNEKCIEIENGSSKVCSLLDTWGMIICGEESINALNNPSHCGECNKKCDSSEKCVMGHCESQCTEDCGDNPCIQMTDGTYACQPNTPPDPCNNGCSNNEICYSDEDTPATCMLDSDGDKVPDEKECCPYNQDVKDIKDIKDDATCSDSICPSKPDTQGVFHIYHAQNLVDLYNYTIRHNYDPEIFNTVVLENDIDLTDLRNENDYNDCQINLKASNTSLFKLTNIVIKSKDNNKRNTIKSSTCSLSQAMFDELINCNVYNINLQFNVKDKNDNQKARAMLTNKIIYAPSESGNSSSEAINQYIDISYSGDIISNSKDAVGGLVAEVAFNSNEENQKPYIFKFKNCLANGISIHAPNATTVGGLVGSGEYIDLSMDDTYPDTPNAFIINDIEGTNNVGGVIGTYIGKYCTLENTNNCGSIPNQNGTAKFRIIFNSIKGSNTVGGFLSAGTSNNNIVILGDSITGNKYIGGITGSGADPIVIDHSSYIAVRINTIEGSAESIGGITGQTGAIDTSYSNILTDIQRIRGTQFVGGIIGEYDVYQTTDPLARINLQSITNKVNTIEGGLYVNGIVFLNNLSNNKYSKYEASMDGISSFVNKLIISDPAKISHSFLLNGLFGIRKASDAGASIVLTNASIASTRKILQGHNTDDNNKFTSDNYLKTQAIGSYSELITFNANINEDRRKSVCYLSTFYDEYNNVSEYPFHTTVLSDDITELHNTNDATVFMKNLVTQEFSCPLCFWTLGVYNEALSQEIPYLQQPILEDELNILNEIKRIYCTTHQTESLCQ